MEFESNMQKLECAKSTVQKWKKGSYEDFDYSRKPGSGRKRKLNQYYKKEFYFIGLLDKSFVTFSLLEVIDYNDLSYR